MIGGGGSSCARADHGIGITEKDAASFVDGYESCTGAREYEHDFGYVSGTSCTTQSQSNSLNLWIR